MNNGQGTAEALFYLFFGIYAAVILFTVLIMLISLIVYVLNGFAFMALFRKVGIEPWAAWVPYFNVWRILEMGGQFGWFSLFVLISPGAIVTLVFECIAAHRTGIAFGKTSSWVVLFFFLPFVWAWLLASDKEVYDPDLIRRAGYGPPLVGIGSVAHATAHGTPPPSPPAAA